MKQISYFMNWVNEFMAKKALWKYNGSNVHVQTSESGMHSDLYLNTDRIISDVLLVEIIVKKFSKELKSRGIKPDWIITYPPFGIVIAYALAREIGAKFGYVDIKSKVCNFNILDGEKVIVVGDDIYSGGSIKKTINIVSDMGAKVEAPILSIGNFSGTKNLIGLEVISIISEKGNLYEEMDCPMCKSGSKAVLPRPNWNMLMKE